MKRKIISLTLLLCLLSLITAGTLAFFTAEEKTVNVITSGNIDIDLMETTDKSDERGNLVPFQDLTGVMPGTTVSKIVEVKNNGDNEAYVRVKVFISVEHEDGIVIDEETSDLISIDFNHEDWSLIDDEYYYYNHRLKPGEITEALFTHVIFSKDMGNDYQNCAAMVGIKAYAVQSDNNGDTVFESMGWPEDSISGN